eukprot:1028423-Pelagomonas_calceolata.AAC.2
MAFRCCWFLNSRTRPAAARSALEGTQPRFTQVPPMSWPSMTATFMPCRAYKGWQPCALLLWARHALHGHGSTFSAFKHDPIGTKDAAGGALADLEVYRSGNGQCVHRSFLPNFLDGVQSSPMATHATSDDDQVIVILLVCCLGHNCSPGLRPARSLRLPASTQEIRDASLPLSLSSLHRLPLCKT